MSHHHIMVRATALQNVSGRVDYISNRTRQDNLIAVHQTVDKKFWKELAAHCQEQAKYSKTKHAREGREFMVSLSNELSQIDPTTLAKMISDKFKELTGTENVVAIHWNGKRNNYHAHVVVAENQEVNEVVLGAKLTRDTYYDENGKRSTKKACVDPEGKLKEGCTFYRKGDRIQSLQRFGSKNEEIGSKKFLQDLKEDMCKLQNLLLNKEQFKVFDSDGPYIAQQHVGKDKPKDVREAIEEKNALVREFNAGIDEMLIEASENGDKAFQDAKEDAVMWRNDIKKHALTERWKKYIETQIKKIKQRIEKEIQKALGIEEEEVQEAPERPRMSLDDRIKATQKKTTQKPSGGHVRTFRDNQR